MQQKVIYGIAAVFAVIAIGSFGYLKQLEKQEHEKELQELMDMAKKRVERSKLRNETDCRQMIYDAASRHDKGSATIQGKSKVWHEIKTDECGTRWYSCSEGCTPTDTNNELW